MTETATHCLWCESPITDRSKIETIGPTPQFSGSTTHQWKLHSTCADEWEQCADRLFRLAREGARHTLIEYPLRHGTAGLR